MKQLKTASSFKKVQYYVISEDEENQRIDNFLFNFLKNVPKSHIYRIIRKGSVRVNKHRIQASYRLFAGDRLRLPPIFIEEQKPQLVPSDESLKLLKERILYEDDYFLIINKPSGMPVHAGGSKSIGVIERMRYLYPKLPQLELGHRLDSETSGCLVLAKKKRILRAFHALLRDGMVSKVYWALTRGRWHKKDLKVSLPLSKHFKKEGKHVVSVNPEGKAAFTIFETIENFESASLMAVTLLTGRTHQIRVHAASKQHPIAGDDRYGDQAFNKWGQGHGINRLFLHAYSIEFTLPSLHQTIKVTAPLDHDLKKGLTLVRGAERQDML